MRPRVMGEAVLLAARRSLGKRAGQRLHPFCGEVAIPVRGSSIEKIRVHADILR
jgi:hypothetical protein